MNEANLPLRSILGKLEIMPPKIVEENTTKELNAGRVIGMLERVIIYVFVLGGQYAALGLILAAKAFARSKKMDDPNFAEYVLIGTLISTTFALMTGELVKFLIEI